ncbi:hypothetical protein VDGL01_07970 [Verticillium dahliae]
MGGKELLEQHGMAQSPALHFPWVQIRGVSYVCCGRNKQYPKLTKTDAFSRLFSPRVAARADRICITHQGSIYQHGDCGRRMTPTHHVARFVLDFAPVLENRTVATALNQGISHHPHPAILRRWLSLNDMPCMHPMAKGPTGREAQRFPSLLFRL